MSAHAPTLESARSAAEASVLQEWTAAFLASDGSDNTGLAEQLDNDVEHWLGLYRLPFDELNRLAGPPGQPTLARLHDDGLERVEDMEDSIDDGWQPPPLVVSVRDDQLVLEDGNHRVEGLRRRGETDYWAVVCCQTPAERNAFFARHGRPVEQHR